MKKAALFIVVLVSVLSVSSCRKGVSLRETSPVEGATNYVLLEMADGGTIVIELYPDIAPVTVANFQKLVASGFYDGLTFHRVIKGFMIQCGDPTGTGLGGAEETIVGEFAANGVENNLSHERGVVSMGRKSTGYDTASSHFFICHEDSTGLDGSYAAFGRVIEGMETVDAIASVKTDENDKPLKDQVIKSATFVER
jgi:peptidyl-prolyl cis-trans isomerase B (cyclophilin B)